MNKRAETIKVGGGAEYAKVAERLKLFREACPNGLIETEMKTEGEQVIFKAHILKDKSDPNSAEATGHAVGSTKGTKAYEKQESISIGRALAILGYLASGEIASSEEMEEFYEYKNNLRDEAIAKIGQSKDMADLKTIWDSLQGNLISYKEVQQAKNDMKLKLEAK